MPVEFTKEQQQAIDLHNCNILVSAAAGSGKTAVLSERIVKIVCDETHPVDIDRLLVVTFTKAAAAEMRERISQEIMKRLAEDGGNEHLQRQSAILHNAQITTIDSFCLFVLKNNFQDIGVDPAFRVADEGEIKLLAKDAMAEVLESEFEKAEEDFLFCVEYFCPNGKEQPLEEHIENMYRYSRSFPFPKDWLTERKRDYEMESVEELFTSPYGQYLLHHLQKMTRALHVQMQRARLLCEEPDGPHMYGELMEKEEEALEKLLLAGDLEAFRMGLEKMTFGRLSTARDASVSQEKREEAKRLRNGVKEECNSILKKYFSQNWDTVVHQSKVCKRAEDALVDLCLKFYDLLDEKKRDRKLMDFSDIEHFALDILVKKDEEGTIIPTETAKEYQAYFEEVLIDEYQDSNLVQEYLLAAVSRQDAGRKNRFMVGDVKQSIYKFRLARPELFLDKYKAYADVSSEAGDLAEKAGNNAHEASWESDNCCINLHKNFRSRKEVIDTVNTVFSEIMREDLGGIVYDEAAALYQGAEYPENPDAVSELLLFEKPDADAEDTVREREAYGVAREIRHLMDTYQVTDKETKKLRPMQYRDVVILLRTNTGWDETFSKVLEKQGIPNHIAGGSGYFKTKEIRDVLQFLRVLDNPLQDIYLFGTMKSVFGGFTDEEIAKIRSMGGKKTTLYENIRKTAEGTNCLQDATGQDRIMQSEGASIGTGQKEMGQNETELGQKCRTFLEHINKYRSYTTYMTILELLGVLFKEYDYLAYVSALSAGGKRLANVEMLLTKAAAFEKNSYYGLFHFIRYMEQLEKYDVDYGEAVVLDENADVVRIMSIHKSKGLEFPVAIVAGLAKKFNVQDASASMIMDTDLGLGIDYVNVESRIRMKTLRKNILSAKLKFDNLAEELRVLYVAMTRAKEKLIMTACVSDVEKKAENRMHSMTYADLIGAGSFLDYLLPTFPNVRCVGGEELYFEEELKSVDREMKKASLFSAGDFADAKELEILRQRFSYEYPYQYLENLYTKTTVSELKTAALHEAGEAGTKELFAEKEVEAYVPSFIRKTEEISGTKRGSAMHRFMELLDFTREYSDVESLQNCMDAFVKEGRLSEDFAQAVRLGKILHFLRTPLAGRMVQAQRVGRLRREQPFVYGVEQVETVLIQGIIDAYFEEDDGIVLMDYKTDVVENGAELAKRYKVQLDYYEEALIALTGKKVKERVLYSFYLGEEVPV